MTGGIQKTQGRFIVLDGVDGCGKSTQAKLIHETLLKRGLDAILTREPGGTTVGKLIRQLVLDPETGDMDSLTEALLFCADRAEHVSSLIMPALEQGSIIISDRYASATAVYQGYAGDLGFPMMNELNRIATKGLEPDLLLILDVDFVHAYERMMIRDAATDRMERGSDEFVNHVYQALSPVADPVNYDLARDLSLRRGFMEYFDRVREGFLRYAEDRPETALVVDATRSIEAVHETIMDAVDGILR